MAEETIAQHLERERFSRRDFLRYCALLAAAAGMPGSARLVAQTLQSKTRLPVIWLEFQDCAGCSEALTRSRSPALTDLVLNKISIDYHETLFAAAGVQAEENKSEMMKKYSGRYLLIVEGSIPVDGMHCAIGGRGADSIFLEAAAGAAAVIATGNCACFGGIPAAIPNPTGARGVRDMHSGKPLVNISGCPAIPEAFTGTLAHFLIFGSLPKLDELSRPKAFYGETIHDRCLRRPLHEAGKFARSFDDSGARQGWCLYKLGCKGPTTYNACASMKWDGGLSFPVQSGHPCLGCSQPGFWDGGGFYEGQSAPLERPGIGTVGKAVAVGAVVGAGMSLANRFRQKDKE